MAISEKGSANSGRSEALPVPHCRGGYEDLIDLASCTWGDENHTAAVGWGVGTRRGPTERGPVDTEVAIALYPSCFTIREAERGNFYNKVQPVNFPLNQPFSGTAFPNAAELRAPCPVPSRRRECPSHGSPVLAPRAGPAPVNSLVPPLHTGSSRTVRAQR